MPFSLLVDEAAVFPLRAVIFQSLLLLVAIAIEATVLRRQLRLGFQPSIRYAASLNIFSVVIGWIVFLGLEPLLPISARTQIISYILFGHFYSNSMARGLGAAIVAIGLIAFFITFWVKAKALEWLTWLLGVPIVKPIERTNPNRIRYGRSRPDRATASPHMLAVLRANALSFTVILLLLLLRTQIGQGI
ncbi:MAG: filament integrity protein FraC [Cyanobacteria bacterium P01_F01_bin.86]